jgi:hypothetical protein
MLKVNQRIDTLERRLGLSDRSRPFVHCIRFVESDGRVTGTMVMSDDPKLCVPYQDVLEGNGGGAE